MSPSNGCIEVATVKRIVTGSDSERLQVDFGKDETELIYARQVRDAREG